LTLQSLEGVRHWRMLKIGDFSKLIRVSVKTLRYYDELGLFKPAQTDPVSGYRFYSVVQLRQLHRILALRDLGFSLYQITHLVDGEPSTEELRGMLRLRRAEQQQRVWQEQDCLERVEALLHLIESENTMNTDEIIIKDTAAQRVASIRGTIPAYYEVGQLFGELFSHLPAEAARGAIFAIWHDEEYKEQDVDAEACVPIDEKHRVEAPLQTVPLPSIKVASVIHHGAYKTLNQSYQLVLKWVEANGYQIGGPFREIYLQYGHPVRQDDPSYVTEIQVPLAKPERESIPDEKPRKTREKVRMEICAM
jgi:effector-binding domain-containing protein